MVTGYCFATVLSKSLLCGCGNLYFILYPKFLKSEPAELQGQSICVLQ